MYDFHGENLIVWNDFIQKEFEKDNNLAYEILHDEIQDYKKTGDITFVLKNLSRIVGFLGFAHFEERTGLNRNIIYGVLNQKIDLDMNVVNKILKAINFKEI
ncbi:MAG: hypothetical protein BWY78_00174 [Alphaproteobacteria bacterium ADurb.Bin438]|nr:MAG: hypothetical protein BWY78_00174 [Alphaproteobacteria bacterium ADurb.Bin438]